MVLKGNIVKDYCVCCGHNGSFYPLDREHVLTKKSRPDLENDPRNLMVVCRLHHQEKNNKGISHMAEKYPTYKQWLIDNGWERCGIYQKWRLFIT